MLRVPREENGVLKARDLKRGRMQDTQEEKIELYRGSVRKLADNAEKRWNFLKLFRFDM